MVDVLSPSPLSSAPIDILNAHTFDSISTFITDSGKTSYNDEQKGRAVKINITGCKDGLGIRIVDAINILKQACGIFVKEVIAGSLAEKDGQLQVGDQLLEVNGINLIGVSREDCRKIMERCTATNHLILLVARDHQSREDFHRLSVSLGNVIDPSAMYRIDFNAGSNPGLTAEQIADNYRLSTITTMTNDTARKSSGSTISSTSLTRVSDISDEPKITEKVDTTSNSQVSVKDTTSGQLSTADVILEVSSSANENKPPLLPISPVPRTSHSDDDSPPPLPSSEPPDLDEDTGTLNSELQSKDLVMPKKRVPTDAEAMMASAGSSIAALATNKKRSTDFSEPEIIDAVTITRQSALGITICGGTNKPEGPHVYIDRVISGLDVANDGTLRPGDRLISINGETMEGITKENALRILTQLKLKRNSKDYQIVYGRKDNRMPPISSTMQTPARKIQPVTPSTIGQPTVVYNSSIFESVTDSTINVPSTCTVVPNDTTTLTSLTSKMNTAKVVSTSTSTPLLPDDDDDDDDWQTKDETDDGVVMREQTTKRDSYKRLTMDPRKKVSFDKLIMAMEYMGRKVSESEQHKMRQSLGIQPGGKVVFQEFADLVKDMFKFKLDMSMMEPTLMGSIERKDSMEIPPLRKSSSSGLTSSDLSRHSQNEDSPRHGSHDRDAELEIMRQRLHQEGQRREEERLRQQQRQQQQQQQQMLSQDGINQQAFLRMQAALQEKDQHCKRLESEIERLKKQVEVIGIEARNYRSQLEQKDLQNKVLLEKSKLPKDVEQLRRKLAVLDCELRKEQNTSRRYLVTTERLTQLAETVQEALDGSDKTVGVFYHPRGTPVRRGDPVAGNPRPPHYLSKHSRYTNTTLAQEVKETVKATKNMLDFQPMPHGWEESSTPDGRKFYINHQNEVTSWVNPITRVYTGANQGSRTSSRTPSHVSMTMPPQQ